MRTVLHFVPVKGSWIAAALSVLRNSSIALAGLSLALALTAPVQAQTATPKITIQPGTITTLAGAAVNTTYVEGNPALGNGFAASAMTFDTHGNLYIANNGANGLDPSNGVSFPLSGVLVIASGNGGLEMLGQLEPTLPKNGDGSLIQSALAGNTYLLAGYANSTIPYVGTQGPGPCDREFAPTDCGGDNALANEVNIGSNYYPSIGDLAVDSSGNLYILDQRTGLRRVDGVTGIISTLIPSSDPISVTTVLPYSFLTLDAAGKNLFLSGSAQFLNGSIGGASVFEYNLASEPSQTLTPIIGGPNACSPGPCGDGGPAVNASLGNGGKVFFDASGNLYVIDGPVIRRVDAKTQVITTISGSTAPPVDGIGDSGPLSSAALDPGNGNPPPIPYLDPNNNLFFADVIDGSVREVNSGTSMSLAPGNFVQAIDGVSFPGNPNPCSSSCATASNANLNSLTYYLQDPQGNGYLPFQGSYIQEVSAASSSYDFGQQTLGTTTVATEPATTYDSTMLTYNQINVPLNFTINNSGSAPLNITNITVSPSTFSQVPGLGQLRGAAVPGLADCTATTVLPPNGQCAIGVSFIPVNTNSVSGTITITSDSSNATSGVNVINLTGSGVATTGTQTQSLTFTPPATATFGLPIALNATATSGLAPLYVVNGGPGQLQRTSTGGYNLVFTGLGAVTVTAYQFGSNSQTDVNGNITNAGYAAATPVRATIMVTPQPLTVKAIQPPVVLLNDPIPATLPYAIYEGNTTILAPAAATTGAPVLTTTAVQGSPSGSYPITISAGTLAAVAPNYTLNPISAADNSTLIIGGGTQESLTFSQIANVTYGAAPVALNAVPADSTTGKPIPGQSVAYTVASGPATISANFLTITGAGSVVVTASVPGTVTYSGAKVSQSFTVMPATLTVTADDQTSIVGQPLPAFTSTITGFVNQDTLSIVQGTPNLSTTANANSPVGTYPVSVFAGGLSAPNYTFIGVAGTLTITPGALQTIAIAPLGPFIYGTAPQQLIVSDSANLPVTLTVTGGPGSISGSVLMIGGAGQISVTATQPGSGGYGPAAPVTQTFTVNPAPLTVSADNLTRPDNTQNPALTFSGTGLVNGDTVSSAFSAQSYTGAGVFISTTAQPDSPPGTYPIVFDTTDFTITSSNYLVTLMPGTLTITNDGPIGSFALAANPANLLVVHGAAAPVTLTISPTNYFQGAVNLSCGKLPANVSCIFSSPSLALDGSGNPVSTVLTINTSITPTVAALSTDREATPLLAGTMLLPGLLGIFGLALRRKGTPRGKWIGLGLMLICLGVTTAAMTACGSSHSTSDNGSGVAASGTSTIMITGSTQSGGPTYTFPLTLTVN